MAIMRPWPIKLNVSMGPAGVIATGYTLAWAGDLLVFMMAPVANSMRMLHGLQQYKQRILLMMVAALAIGVIGSVYTTLILGYRHGANNMAFSAWFAKEPFRFARNFILNPVGPYWAGWGWTWVGAAIMVILIWARHHLLWWPFHPIGYMVSGTWMLNSCVVQHLHRLADQDRGPEVPGSERVPPDALVLPGHDPGAVRSRGSMGDSGRFHRDDGQPDPHVLKVQVALSIP